MNFGKFARRKKLERIDSTSTKVAHFVSSTFLKVLVFAIVLVGVMGVAAGFGTLNAFIDASPSIDHLLEEIVPEGYTTFIYDLNGNKIEELHGADANRVYVEYDQIPDYLGYAYVAIEDERFFEHNGVDLEGFIRAIFVNIQSMSFSEGASTITQQIIKNNVLTTDVTIERKLQEMYLAIQLEKYQSKEDILELYMNTAASGRGTNGVQTASRLYFNKDVWDINLAEAAVLASITNKPGKFDPVTNPENNRERALRILNKLLEQGYITEDEYEEAKAIDVYSQIQINHQTVEKSSDYSYFVDETISEVVEDLVIQKGLTEGQAFNLIYRGGLSIYITQDLDIQASMDEIFTNEENFPPVNEDFAMKVKYSLSYPNGDIMENFYHEELFDTQELADAFIAEKKAELGITDDMIDQGIAFENSVFIPQPQAAMVIMDYHNGYVKAMAGGRGEKSGNQVLNRAYEALRQPGSTFKILAAYLPAIDARGYTLATGIDDVPLEIVQPSGNFSPGNWYKGYRGLSTVREGIVWSMNILAVKTVFDIGPELSYDYLMDLGFTTVYDEIKIGANKFTDITLSLPLGGLTKGVSPIELTAAYGAIANKGVYTEPILYTRVLDHDGNILLNKEPVTRPVMKETTAYLLTDAMVETVVAGTGTATKFKEVDMAQAGKTGTTNSTKDLWFAGYTPYYVAAVWMGYDEPQEMAYVKNYHKWIWRDAMEAAHVGLPYKDFERPEGITSATICTESGLLATEACTLDPRGESTTRTELFAVGTVPTETCNVHEEVLICKDSGLFVNEYCPDESHETVVMLRRPEPIIVAEGDEAILDTIADYQYTIPFSMIGEYCNVHGPDTVQPEEPQVDEFGNPIVVPDGETTPSDSETPSSEGDNQNNGSTGDDTGNTGNSETNTDGN